MVRYWCENCTTWVDEGDVTEEKETVERGDPPKTVHYHDYCGNLVEEPDEKDSRDKAIRERHERP